MKNIINKHIFIYLFLTFSCSVYAIPTNFRAISIENGLSSNRINTIFKDSRGFIWLGTQVGINRYDGNEIKQFPLLGNDEFFSINETNETFLWVGSENGIKKLNRITHEVETVDLGIVKVSVRDIKMPDSLNVFLATNRGFFCVQNNGIQHIVFENGLSGSNSLTGIACSDSANYWFSSQAGICHYNIVDKTSQVYKFSLDHTNLNNYTSIVCIDSIIYVGSYNKGVIRFDIKSKKFSILPEFHDNYVLTIKHYDNNLYIGTNGHGLKIYSLANKSTKIIRHEVEDPYSINSNAIYSFLLGENIYWIGTYKGGLNYNPNVNNYFQTYQTPDFNAFDYNVRSFFLSDNGDKLIGTRNGLVYISEKRNIYRKYTQNDNSILSSDIILYVTPYKDNKFFVGTYGGGMYVYDTNTLKLSRFRKEDVFISGCIFRFSKDQNDTWWIATDRGLFEYNEKTNTINSYTTTNSRLVNNNILYLYEDSKNRLWLGTSEGLCILDKSSKIITSSENLASYPELKVIINMLEDSEGNIWIASHQAFAKLNSSLSGINPISFNQENIGVMSIIEDENKHLWLASTQGIIKYNILNSKYKTYNMSDGVLSYDFANVVQATSASDIWWANEKGLIHCYLPDLDEQKRSQKPVVTDIVLIKNPTSKVCSNSPEFTDKLILSTDQNDIQFKFSLLSYSISQANIYEYMLEGYDKTWKTQIGNNEVSYYRLSPGKYIFRIRDVNDSELESTIDIIIREDTKKVLFPAIFILLFLVSIVVLYRNRERAIRKLKEKFSNEKYAHSKIEQSDAKKVAKQLEIYMKTDKPYLNAELKQSEVAKKIKTSPSELSQILNHFLGVSFSDYVNKFRIEELVEKMKGKSSAKYTLTALAEQCGFSSRSSFFRAIKKHTKQTPAEFLKKADKKV